MNTKADYTKEEWDLLMKAPLMAAMAVVAASPSGPIGVLKELFAAGKGLVEGERASNPLIAAVVSDVKAGARPSLPDERPTDIQRVKDQALQACRDVAALLARKAPRDGEGFKRWLVETAQRAAEAAKEGGFLGIGGTRISDAEKGALADVAGALEVPA